MGLFDTIMNRGAPQTNAPIVHTSQNSAQGTNQQQPAPQPNPNDKFPQNNPGADPNNGVPSNGNSQPTKDPVISQLDQFQGIWDTPAADPKAVDPLTQPLLTYDPT